MISVVSECSSYPSWTSLHRQVYQCERWGDLASSHCSSTLTRLPMMPAGSEVCNTNAYTVHQTQAWLNYSNLNWEHITRYCNKKIKKVLSWKEWSKSSKVQNVLKVQKQMEHLKTQIQRSMFHQGKNNTICTVDNISDDTLLGLHLCHSTGPEC